MSTNWKMQPCPKEYWEKRALMDQKLTNYSSRFKQCELDYLQRQKDSEDSPCSQSP